MLTLSTPTITQLTEVTSSPTDVSEVEVVKRPCKRLCRVIRPPTGSNQTISREFLACSWAMNLIYVGRRHFFRLVPIESTLHGGTFQWHGNLFVAAGSPSLTLRCQIFRTLRQNPDIAADSHKSET
jgi:hypothetical protein